MQTWKTGDIVGERYRLGEPIPACGWPAMWCAEDTAAAAADGTAALCWLLAVAGEDATATARLRDALESAAAGSDGGGRGEHLAHVVALHESFAVLDVGGGEPLSALLPAAAAEWSTEQRHAVVLALFAALHKLHATGLVHGRLTPADVALHWDEAGAPQVRLARVGVVPPVPVAGPALPYADPAAPADGTREPRADLFAAGAVARQVLTGRPLAYGEPLPAWLARCVGPWRERYHDAVAAQTAVRMALSEPAPPQGEPVAADRPAAAAATPAPVWGGNEGYGYDDDGTYAVVLQEQQALAVPDVAPILTAALGMHRIDANRRARRQQGVLVRGAAARPAHAVVQQLAELGVAAEVVGDPFLGPPPKPRSALYVDAYAEGLILTKEGTEPTPWARVDWVAVALIPPNDVAPLPQARTGAQQTLRGAVAELSAEERAAIEATLRRRQTEEAAASQALSNPLVELPRWLEIVAKDVFEVQEKGLPEAYLDIVLREPAMRYRVPAKDYLPAALGQERTPNWLRNLWVLARRLEPFLSADARMPSFDAFCRGQADASLRVDLLSEFDEAQSWFSYRKRQRELAALLDE